MAIEAEALLALSEKATQGDWSVSGVRKTYNEPSCVIVDSPSCAGLFALATAGGHNTIEALFDAKFIVALVSAYRDGSLIHRSALAEDTARAAEGARLPAGWKAVPMVPTTGMRRRLASACGGSWDVGDHAWEQALAAAPALPLTKEAADANR